MDVEFYKVLHLWGIFMILASLGGMCLHVINGGTRTDSVRKFAMMSHGIGLLITAVAGFGLLEKEHLAALGMPGWVIGKVVIWLILGMLPAFIYRMPKLTRIFWALTIALPVVAAWLVIYKPF
jgi:hypothetical protein